MDCQVRTMWLDLTGGRCFLNSVVAYQKPTFALTMNMYAIPPPTIRPPAHSLLLSHLRLCRHGFGERFIASAVANPVGLYRALCKTNTAKDEVRIVVVALAHSSMASAHHAPHAPTQDLYNCTWLAGVEADTAQRNGAFSTRCLSFALTRRNTSPFPFSAPHTTKTNVRGRTSPSSSSVTHVCVYVCV
jgi:hypothetical protein